MKQNHLNGRQARWCMYLAGFDFVIRHQPGKRNPADGPSRRSDYADEAPPDHMEWMPTIQNKMARAEHLQERLASNAAMKSQQVTVQSLKVQSERDARDMEWIGRSQIILRRQAHEMARLEQIYAPEVSETRRESILKLQVTDSVTNKIKERVANPRRKASVSREWSLGRSGELLHNQRLFVPAEQAVKQEILHLFHDDPMAGHFGPVRTLELIERKFYWEQIRKDVRDHCKSCHIWQMSKPRRHQKYSSLESLPIPSRLWQEISMDFIVGFPTVTTRNGDEKDAILVVVDRYTKMNRFFAVSSEINSQELAELIHQEIELKYGVPDGCVSDRGSVFTSQFWSDICYLNRVHRKLSTAFHPQTDGQTERSNQTLIQYLRCFAAANPMIWAHILPEAEFVCNNVVNATTNLSPFRALMGYDPTISRRIEGDAYERRLHPNAIEQIHKLETLRRDLEQHWSEAVANHKRFYNTKEPGSALGQRRGPCK